MTSTEWPNHFPQNCPPADADDLAHAVLYLVEGNPPTAEDFLSACERNQFVGKPECERASLSCGLTEKYIMQLKEAVPRLRTMHIAKADLIAGHGKIKPTGKPGHHSMWLYAGALKTAPSLFRVVQ